VPTVALASSGLTDAGLATIVLAIGTFFEAAGFNGPMTTSAVRRAVVPILLGLGVATAIGVGGGGFGGVATACAQTVPTQIIPTLGPLDPTCSRAPDTDQDGVLDFQDNCQGTFNPRQDDTDKDSGDPPYQPINVFPRPPETGGDACDTDDDGDGVVDVNDNCSKKVNQDQADRDGDGVGDVCDPNPNVPAFASGSAGPLKLTISGLHRVQHLPEIQAGVTVPVRCSHQCAIAARLTVTARGARKLRIGKTTLLGRGFAGLDATGSTFVFVKLTKSAMSHIAKRGSARVTLRLTVTDNGGHRKVVTRRLTIRR
jgi:thrombospondin type 3 repeat protein